ncbi:MAG TPA: hypothetical protein VGM56_00965 [Byssovorax sp.]
MLAAATPACGSDSATPAATSTSTTSTGAGGESGAGGSASGWGATDCGACAQQACASYVASCDSDPECPAYLSCVLACPAAAGAPTVDEACVTACSTGSSSESKLAAADLYACFTVGDGAKTCAACGDMIVIPPGPAPEQCGTSTDPDACAACADENCCTGRQACQVADGDCQGFIMCAEDCTAAGGSESTCYTQCAPANAAGEAVFAQYFACTEYSCTTECGQPNACDQCRLSVCKVETYNLQSSPDGLLLFECFDECIHAPGGMVDTCETACFADEMDQLDLFDMYEECLTVGCKDECMNGQ